MSKEAARNGNGLLTSTTNAQQNYVYLKPGSILNIQLRFTIHDRKRECHEGSLFHLNFYRHDDWTFGHEGGPYYFSGYHSPARIDTSVN